MAADPEANRGNPELPRPACQALLLCDYAIREQLTNKTSAVGIFDRIQGQDFPLIWAHRAFVYARVTDAQGRYPFRLDLVRLRDEQSVGRIEWTFELADRIGSYDLLFPINGMRFETPGTYEFQLFADINGGGAGQPDFRFVGGMRLNVLEIKQGGQS